MNYCSTCEKFFPEGFVRNKICLDCLFKNSPSMREIGEKVKLAAMEYELEKRIPGFTDPVRKKS